MYPCIFIDCILLFHFSDEELHDNYSCGKGLCINEKTGQDIVVQGENHLAHKLIGVA